MKTLLLILSIIICNAVYSQGGVYLSIQDYKNGKLTDASDDVKVTATGIINIKVGVEKKSYKPKDVWGYRIVTDGVSTDYRIIVGFARAIYSTGAIWVYGSGRDYFNKQSGKLTYVKVSTESGHFAFPIITKGPDGPIQPITSWKKLLAILNPPKQYEENVKKGLGGSSLIEALGYYNDFISTYPGAPQK